MAPPAAGVAAAAKGALVNGVVSWTAITLAITRGLPVVGLVLNCRTAVSGDRRPLIPPAAGGYGAPGWTASRSVFIGL